MFDTAIESELNLWDSAVVYGMGASEEILSRGGIHIFAVQNHYSLLYRSSEKAGILGYCKENGITFFAYMVLEQGGADREI